MEGATPGALSVLSSLSRDLGCNPRFSLRTTACRRPRPGAMRAEQDRKVRRGAAPAQSGRLRASTSDICIRCGSRAPCGLEARQIGERYPDSVREFGESYVLRVRRSHGDDRACAAASTGFDALSTAARREREEIDHQPNDRNADGSNRFRSVRPSHASHLLGSSRVA